MAYGLLKVLSSFNPNKFTAGESFLLDYTAAAPSALTHMTHSRHLYSQLNAIYTAVASEKVEQTYAGG